LAVFWYFDESLITSGEESVWVSSSYLASIWFNLSNIFVASLPTAGKHGRLKISEAPVMAGSAR